MISQRRCAQFGLISACLTLVTMLTILFRGSYEAASGQHRFGVIANGSHDPENSAANVKVAAMGK